MIYLDYCATTPMSETSLEIYTKAAKEFFGNPSSLHDYGTTANQLLDQSRVDIAKMINGEKEGIYFTSGGSESNYLSLLSIARGNKHRGNHIITTNIEHPSVLNSLELLKEEGFRISFVPVNSYGEVELEQLERQINPETVLVSIGHANSELGTIQNMEEIGLLLKDRNIFFHSDCVQTFGKVPIDVRACNLSAVTMSAHKIYGPKGVGAVYLSPELSWKATVPNSTQEKGFRQGTGNVPGIAAFTIAASQMFLEQDTEMKRCQQLQQLFLNSIDRTKIILEGHPTNRLAHHLCLRIKGIEGQYIMLECNRRGIAISTGSACKVGQTSPSRAMTETGKTLDEAREMIRISFGRETTEEHIRYTVAALNEIIEQFYSH
ncbi:IscS subfamily cysteine desulfurase [Alkalihalobacterium chitinilyticum]|uniref:IscS subfamily cysteine desulfurase n=1 Tax=Alkalihalobacterium chitinilyticum TaxID=2980103 RepID=A0ABT5VHT7_9BACI|nr:IscS subfamily cysteine desulfurase [Alkalihalobacterium chitinilyticum]MDE5415009.1 IscS subfamily cysteine desulfurase [Alkalihalobacterium chitinilyticum]